MIIYKIHAAKRLWDAGYLREKVLNQIIEHYEDLLDRLHDYVRAGWAAHLVCISISRGLLLDSEAEGYLVDASQNG